MRNQYFRMRIYLLMRILMNPLCIFGHEINKEQLKGGTNIEKCKKDSYSSKAILCVEVYFMFFLP
jgi:hypothetical protein